MTHSGDDLVLGVEVANDGCGGFRLDDIEHCLTQNISCLVLFIFNSLSLFRERRR